LKKILIATNVAFISCWSYFFHSKAIPSTLFQQFLLGTVHIVQIYLFVQVTGFTQNALQVSFMWKSVTGAVEIHPYKKAISRYQQCALNCLLANFLPRENTFCRIF